MKKFDKIESPAHYVNNAVEIDGRRFEPVDLAENFDYKLGSAVKYLIRYKDKGAPVTDLKKAKWYLHRILIRNSVVCGVQCIDASGHVEDRRPRLAALISAFGEKNRFVRTLFSGVGSIEAEAMISRVSILDTIELINEEIRNISELRTKRGGRRGQ